MADRANPYKVVVFGAGAVGKSSVVLRFVTDKFASEYLPTIEDCYRKNCLVDERTAFLDILDTAGQEEYSALRDQWVREGKVFILVFSVTSRESFEDIPSFRERITLVQEDDVPPMVLVGNKADLVQQREVSPQEGQLMADKYGIPYVETSALTGLNCAEVFHTAVRQIRSREEVHHKKVDDDTTNKKKKWKFCTML